MYAWYGHIHFNSNYSYTPAELAQHAPGLKLLDSHVVGRCAGNWACSGAILRDGTPRGFVLLELTAGTMAKVTTGGYDAAPDPLYAYWFPRWKAQNIKGFRENEHPRPYDNSHLFKFTPPAGTRTVEIRFTDRWGAPCSRTVSW